MILLPFAGDDSSKRGGWINSVKSMMTRVADQVSQVCGNLYHECLSSADAYFYVDIALFNFQ